jgi:hypothetical protein
MVVCARINTDVDAISEEIKNVAHVVKPEVLPKKWRETLYNL